MDEERQPGIITDALLREAVSVAGTVLLIWLLSGTGRTCAAAVKARIKARIRGRGDRIDAEVSRFRAQVSRWEHEQAAQANRRPGTGTCGSTSQLPPLRQRRHAHEHAHGACRVRAGRRRRPADDPPGHRERRGDPRDRAGPVRPGIDRRRRPALERQGRA